MEWAVGAVQDRRDIVLHLAAENPAAAVRLDAKFAQAAASLHSMPHRGRPGLLPGTREVFPHRHYRLVYQVTPDKVTILTPLHTARLWPALAIDPQPPK